MKMKPPKFIIKFNLITLIRLAVRVKKLFKRRSNDVL